MYAIRSYYDFPAETDIAEVAAMLLRQHDDHWGGFGEWQKFPNPDAVDFLLAEYRQTGKPRITSYNVCYTKLLRS